MCHENKMGAAKEQHPYIICRLDKQKWWNSSGTVTRPLFSQSPLSGNIICTARIILRPVNTGALRPTTKIGVKSTGAAIIR